MDDVRWLDAGEQQAWRAYLGGTRLLLDALDRQLQTDSGLSLADYELLVRLSDRPDRRLRMSELAAVTLFSRSRLSHAVSRLEQIGWVRRVTCDSDGRGTWAELTDEGFAHLVAAAPGHVTAVREHLFDHLPPQHVAVLRAMGEAIQADLDPAGSCAGG